MKYVLTFFLLLAIPSLLFAQGDMLLLRKKNNTVKTFYEGSEIIFDAGMGMQRAMIYQLKKDSVFLVQYQVEHRMTSFGAIVLDTVAAYRTGIHYKEIRAIGNTTSGFWNASGASLFGGGALLTTAGLLSWVLAKPDTRYYARPELVIAGAALAGAGFLLMKSSGKKMKIGKKYSLQYISPK